MRIKEAVDLSYPTVSRNMTMKEAVSLLNSHQLSLAPVVENNRFYGVILSYDKPLLGQDIEYLQHFTVKEAILTGYPTTYPDIPIYEAPFTGVAPLPVVDSNGTYHGVLIPSAVIAVLNRNETKHLSKMFDELYEGVVIFNKEGIIIFANREALRIFRLSLNEIINQPSYQVFPNSPIYEVLNTGQPILGKLYTVGETTVIIDYKSIKINNQQIGSIATFRDISTLNRVTSELSSYNFLSKQLNAMINYSRDGLCVINHEAVILTANDALAEVMGTPKDRIIGRHVTHLENDGILDRAVSLKVLSNKAVVTITQQSMYGKRWLTTGTPVYNVDGSIIYVVSTATDVQKLNRLWQEAEISNIMGKRKKYFSFSSDDLKKIGIITGTDTVFDTIAIATRVAKTDATVLIQGESGTGKELIANLIHNFSPRKQTGKFVRINCGAIPKELLEAELFGYAPGAFTGAKKEGKKGMFEIAHNGTLFLDEIGEMPLELQVKILRAIQEGEIIRVGSTDSINFNTRIIAATNQELKKLVSEGKFRGDLYYRLNVVPILIPPLRERRGDIRLIANHYLTKFNEKHQTNKELAEAAYRVLENYDWPGNVRELKNLIERLVLTVEEDLIHPLHLPYEITNLEGMPMLPLNEALEKVERELIIKALALYGSTYKVAEVLGVSQSTVVRKAKKYLTQERLNIMNL